MGKFAIAILLILSMPVWAAPPVEVTGLFKNQAIVRLHGKNQHLKVGETSPDGITLVSATALAATVKYRGETYHLSLTDHVAGSFKETELARISIPADNRGQYRIKGSINGQFVGFLVDTGASVVALSAPQAQALGLNYRSGEKGVVETAQGRTDSYFLILDEVNVGGINIRNVRAAVIDGNFPSEVLLGMTYLRKVELRENNEVMTLTAKY